MQRQRFKRLDLLTGARLWTPAVITTAAWYDAADKSTITHASNAVSQWNDKSGNANHATQATGSLKPTTGSRINSLNAISFDGTDSMSHSFASSQNAITLFVVTSPGNNSAGYRGIFASDDSNTGTDGIVMLGNGGTARWGTYQSGGALWQPANTNINSVGPILLGMVEASSGNGTFFYNGLSNGTYTQSAGQGVGGAHIGGLSGQLYIGDVGEIIVLQSEASTTDRQKVEGYLAWKWGLVHNLPVDHPYKRDPPKI